MATKVYDIENLPDRPYDNFMQRSISDTPGVNTEGTAGTPTTSGESSSSGGSSSSSAASENTTGNGSVETMNVKTANALNDLWITTYIKSDNWQSGARGFWIDGPSGYAEFMNVKIVGNISATTGTIGGFTIGALDLTATFNGNTTTLSSGTLAFSSGPTGNPTTKIYQNGDLVTSTVTITGGTVGGAPVAQIGFVATSTADIVPLGLTCSSTTAVVASEGTVSSSVVLTWTSIVSNTFDYYIIRYKKATSTYYTYINSNINTITIEGLVPNISYNFGISSVNKYGSVSAYSTDISQTTATSTTAPATVVVNSATAGIQYVVIEWVSSSSTDLASYNIYRNTINDSSTSDLVGNCRTNYFVDGGRVGGQIYYYWVKAINSSGLLSASFSIVVSATPRDVTSADIVELAGTKVLIDGAVYLSNWRHGGDLTKIDGGDIYTGSVTTAQLNFVPVMGSDIIASINASTEGLFIKADRITVSGSTSFASGYNPTDKVAELGGTYTSSSVGPRVKIFPTGDIGIQVIDSHENDAFKVMVGGTDVGDVIIGNYAGGQGIKYDQSANSTTFQGSIMSKSAVLGGSLAQFTMSNGGMNSFGDGFNDTGSGTYTITGNVTFTQDMYYKSLIIAVGAVLNPNGWRLFCTDTLTVNGAIRRNGNNGTNGTSASGQNKGIGGNPGLGLSSGYLNGSISGVKGGDGGMGIYNSYPGFDGTGSFGISVLNSIGNNGSIGGSGGKGSYGGWIGYTSLGGGSSYGLKTNANVRLTSNWHLQTLLDITSNGSTIKYQGSSGSGGGGGGGGGAGRGQFSFNGRGGGGGGGGGSGSCGGMIAIYAKNILVNVGGSIETIGGNGGNGGNGGDATDDIGVSSGASGGGGGGGGGGGNGGELILVYNNLSVLGTINTSGGTGGTGGTKGLRFVPTGTDGENGYNGNNGTAGEKKYYQVSM